MRKAYYGREILRIEKKISSKALFKNEKDKN